MAHDQNEHPTDHADAVASLHATVRRMVSPGGCAWHESQTHESLVPFLVEETAEFIDAIERGLPASEVAEELGDVLYQVLFHSAIAERDGEGYDFAQVAGRLNDKLIARHPHVFGDRGYMTVEQLHDEWERLKEDAAGARRGSRGALEGIPAGMPTLARAAKVVERLKRARVLNPQAEAVQSGFDGGPGGDLDETALGEAMLGLVIEANAAGLDPDRALRLATSRLAEQLAPAPVEE